MTERDGSALSAQTIQLLRESLPREKSECKIPYVFVVFGASGDLAKKKIYPTLYWLFRDGLIPQHTYFIGYARSSLTVDALQDKFKQYCKVKATLLSAYFDILQLKPEHEASFTEFMKRQSYISGQYNTPDGYKQLQKAIAEIGVSALKLPRFCLNFTLLSLFPPVFYSIVC